MAAALFSEEPGSSRRIPHWRDYLLFYEYFHGDNGAGLGASHQTGWTGVIARTLHLFATLTPEQALTVERRRILGVQSLTKVAGSPVA